jgi:hypothetical protein
MFGLSIRAPRAHKPFSRRSVRPFLERLEDRLSPSTITAVTENLTMNVTYQPNKQVQLAGQLTSNIGPVVGQAIDFSGAVNGTTTTGSNGYYRVTLPASQLGQVNAVSADGLSNTATATLVNGSPTISNFTATPEGGGMWLFSGTVTNAPTQGEVVHLSGITALQNAQVNVNPDGTFDYYAIVSSGQGGWADAEAVDWWGDISPIATTLVNC